MKKITGLSDKMFKAIMYRNSEILMSVLGNIFDKKITKIEYLSPELPVKKFVEKGKRLDLYLEETDSYIDIEITKDYNIYIVNRNLGYGFQIYLDSVKVSDKYKDYKKVHAVQLIGNKRGRENIINYYIRDNKGVVLSDKLLYSEIYIDNFVKMYYNKDEEIEKYKYLIMLGLDIESLRKFSEEYGDEIVRKYREEFEKIASRKIFEPWLSEEEDEEKIRNTLIDMGYERGEKNKQIEIAKNLLKQGLSIDIISSVTGLSVTEIEELK